MHIKITDGARIVLDTDMSFLAFSLIHDGECCGSIITSTEGASIDEIQAAMAAITINFQRLMDENPEVAEAAGELEKVIEVYKRRGRILEGRGGDDLFGKAAAVRGQSTEDKLRKIKEMLKAFKREEEK